MGRPSARRSSTRSSWPRRTRIHADGTPADWDHVDGDQFGLSPFYRLYQCRDDRWLFVAAKRPDDEERLIAAVDADVKDLGDADKVAATLEARFRERPAAEWFDVLDAAGVPIEIADEEFCRALFDDPAARAAQLVAETWAASTGRFEDPGLLVNLSTTPGTIQRGPCMCGEHTREVLLEHGYTDSQIDDLSTNGVVLDAPVAPPMEET